MAGVPVGDTTLLDKLREQGVLTWERRIMGDGHPSMFSADITDEVVTLIEQAAKVERVIRTCTVEGIEVDADGLGAWAMLLAAAVAPFVGEATK